MWVTDHGVTWQEPRPPTLKDPHDHACMWVTDHGVTWQEPRPPTFKDAVDDGYRAHIQPHHPW